MNVKDICIRWRITNRCEAETPPCSVSLCCVYHNCKWTARHGTGVFCVTRLHHLHVYRQLLLQNIKSVSKWRITFLTYKSDPLSINHTNSSMICDVMYWFKLSEKKSIRACATWAISHWMDYQLLLAIHVFVKRLIYNREKHVLNIVSHILFTHQQMHYLLNLERFKILH
jgi:hypothetical protein